MRSVADAPRREVSIVTRCDRLIKRMPTRNRKLIILLLSVCAVCLSMGAHSTTLLPAPPSASAAQGENASVGLTAQEKRGKAFYLRSESSTGQEIMAYLGEVDVPASTLTCAGCHGPKGQGKSEGGVTAGSLTWSHLTKSYGHVHESGRKHPAFSESSFIRALTGGLDPAGNKLAVAMPTYRMTQSDMADLIAYLKRIETDHDPGLTESSLVLGTILPDKGPLADMGQAMKEVLLAYFDDINNQGGIYNRKIELRIAAAGGDATSSTANVKHLVEQSQVFAIVSGVIAGAEPGITALSRKAEAPFVGPATLLPQSDVPLNRYVFYLLPGLKEQARALVNFAARKIDPRKSRAAIVCADADLNRQIAVSIEDQAKKQGWTTMVKTYYTPAEFKAAGQVVELKQQGIETVFFIGSGTEATALFNETVTSNWTPNVYILGSLAGKDISETVPEKMKDKIFLAFPTVPSDIADSGAAEYKALLERYKIKSSVHAAARISALAAAKTMVEALKLAGKDLSRERLIATLEGLYEFETGLTPKITFGPNRRIGSLGAYIVTIDPAAKRFPASVEWIAAE